MLLEICEYVLGLTSVPVGRGGTLVSVGRVALPREHTSAAPWRFHVSFWVEIEHGRETLVGAINRRPV